MQQIRDLRYSTSIAIALWDGDLSVAGLVASIGGSQGYTSRKSR